MQNLPYDKGLLLISVTGNGCGVIESRMLKERFTFRCADEMLFLIAQILDAQRVPMATAIPRRFIARRKVYALSATPFQHEPVPVPEAKKSFWLVVRSRNFSDWQGIIEMPDILEPVSFRSVVALSHLISEAGYLNV